MSSACDWLSGMRWGEAWHLACLGDARPAMIATLGALAILMLFFAFAAVRAVRLRGSGLAYFLSLPTALCVPAAGLSLAIAAGVPALVHVADAAGQHLIVAVDHSASARRLPQARTAVLERVAAAVARTGTADSRMTVSIVAFADTASVASSRVPPPVAARLLAEDRQPPGVSATGSSIAAALAEAVALAAASPEGDAVVLLTDGNQTTGDAELPAKRLGEMGVPVFVEPLDAGAPSEGIVSSYLPATVESGAEPKARIVFDPGRSADPSPWTFSLARNGEALDLGPAARVEVGDRARQIAVPVRFEGRGVQYLEAGLERGGTAYSARLFTLVNAPIRILAHGEARFLDALPPERFRVERHPPDAGELAAFDIVVVDGLPAGDFPPARLEEMAAAVRGRGMGLFLVNGPMRGSPGDQTVIRSYRDTPLDPLLPVTADPRFVLDDPPPRDIIVMLDTSGSMGGGGLATAAAAIKALSQMMRPQDRMQAITFAGRRMGWTKGDPAGLASIAAFVDGLQLEGASDASIAFREAVGEAGNYTAVFLLTDGDLVPYDYNAAGLSFYYLEYGGGSRPSNAAIAAAARQSWMLSPASIVAIQPDFFRPKPRAEFFIPERFVPKAVLAADPEFDAGIAVPGVAVSYPRVDARRVLVRPAGDGEPVLAFRRLKAEAGGGRTGAFMSAFEGEWLAAPRGREAIEACMRELASWSERERYDLRLDDRGSDVGVALTVLAGDRKAVPVDGLDGTIVFGDDAAVSIGLKADPARTGVFRGSIRLPAASGSVSGALILVEGGAGSVDGHQIVPVLLPGARAAPPATSEAATRGVDGVLLEAIAELSGGKVGGLAALGADAPRRGPPPRQLHPWFLALAGLFFAVAMTGREVKL